MNIYIQKSAVCPSLAVWLSWDSKETSSLRSDVLSKVHMVTSRFTFQPPSQTKFTVTDALNQQQYRLVHFGLIAFFQQFLVSHIGSPLFSCLQTYMFLLACY